MVNMPQLEVKQTFAKIGINKELSKLDIKQPKADIKTNQEFSEIEIDTTQPRMDIDQSAAFKALGKVPTMELTKIVSNNYINTGLKAINKIAEKGEHFQKIHLYNNPIVEHAKNDSVDFSAYNYVGKASCDNVDIDVTLGELSISWSDAEINIDVQVNEPEFKYYRGYVDIYLKQKNSIEKIPPKIDITL